ncbi:hypothetical protein IZY60_04115 [Lutibacter sp. B2]|nr:hypothetical protein [Lutibacter sp. B2]
MFEKDLLNEKNNSLKFFSKLDELRRKEPTEKISVKNILVNLNREHNIDIYEIAVSAIEQGYSCFDVHHVLEDSIPVFQCNIESFLRYLETMYVSMEGDLAQSIQYKPILQLVEKQPKIARELLDEMVLINKPFCVGCMATIFQGLSIIDFEGVYDELIEIVYSKQIHVVQASIFALGDLICNKADQKKAQDVINIFEDLLRSESKELYYCITNVLCKFYDLDNRSIRLVLRLCKIKEDSVSYQVSNFLFHELHKIYENDWFEELLLTMSNVNCKYTGIIDNIDFILAKLIKNSNKELAKQFLHRWALDSDYFTQKMDIKNLFNSTIRQIIMDSELFSELITIYFSENNYQFHKITFELIGYAKLCGVSEIEFHSEIIKNMEYDEVVYLSTKVLGYVFDVNTLCSLMYSILKIHFKDDRIAEEVGELFYEFIGKNYPYSTCEFLKTKVDNTQKLSALNTILTNIIKSLEKDNDIQNLKEVKQPSRYRNNIMLEKNREFNKAMEQTGEESTLINLVSKVTLKYGKGWFQYHNNDFGEISELAKISQSVEMPKSQISYRVSDELQRVQFRMAKRRDT